MRKYVFLFGLIMVSLCILSIKPSYGLESYQTKEIEVSSNDFLEFVHNEGIKNIKRICTDYYCEDLRGSSIEKAFSRFLNNYEIYLTERFDEAQALEMMLKGFPITKIETLY